MQDLRYILVALGGIAIAAVLIHGLLSNNKKNRQVPIKDKPLDRMDPNSRDGDDPFDSDGIGQVRVVSGGRRAEPKLQREESRPPAFDRVSMAAFDDEEDEDEVPPVARQPNSRPVTAPLVAEDEDAFDDPLSAPVTLTAAEPVAAVRKPAQVNRRTPVYRSRPQHEPQVSSFDEAPLAEPAYATAPTFGARSQPSRAPEAVKATALQRDTVPDLVASPDDEEGLFDDLRTEPAPVEKIWQDVYVINLMGRPGHELQGATLLSSLLTLGFKFGEMDIFHRHEDANGKGEVLFSMINMVKPGTFNPYRMEQFSTPGVSLFMQLPLRSNAAFAFEDMLQAADQLASDLDAMLTDMERSPLSDETIARYRHELAAYEASRD